MIPAPRHGGAAVSRRISPARAREQKVIAVKLMGCEQLQEELCELAGTVPFGPGQLEPGST
eukprot:3108461-Rhodomonas_salina.2